MAKVSIISEKTRVPRKKYRHDVASNKIDHLSSTCTSQQSVVKT